MTLNYVVYFKGDFFSIFFPIFITNILKYHKLSLVYGIQRWLQFSSNFVKNDTLFFLKVIKRKITSFDLNKKKKLFLNSTFR